MTATTTATDTRYLACHQCGRLHPLPRPTTPTNDDAATATAEGLQEFRAEHGAHPLDVMWRLGTALRASGPVWDPMSLMTFMVTDGRSPYVVSVDRPTIDDPRIYRFVPGELETAVAAVSVEDSHLLRGLDRELYPYAVRRSKLESFLGAVREVLEHVDVDELDVAFDDADDPAVSIARLPDGQYAELLECCARIFDDAELPRVHTFLAANRFEDGLLALRVRHEYRVAA